MTQQIVTQPAPRFAGGVRYFVGRSSIIRTLTARMLNGDSSSVVGPPHIGKTSLLKYLCAHYQEKSVESSTETHMCLLFFDCHMLPGSYSPSDFFRQLWSRLRRYFPEGPHLHALNELDLQPVEPWTMNDLFTQFARTNRRIVLLLDEFDTLFQHERFHHGEFFGALRSLSSTTNGGLALITASRLSVAEMNRRTQQRNPTGSPFFNNNIQISLRQFSLDEVAQIFAYEELTTEEQSFIIAVAGRHPFLLDCAVKAIHERRAAHIDTFQQTWALLQERVAAHCADQWHCLPIHQQEALRALMASVLYPSELSKYSVALSQLCADGVLEIVEDKFRISAGLLHDWLTRYMHTGQATATHDNLNRPEVRTLINSILRTDSSLDAFCLDHFLKTYQQFTNGMDRQHKVNLLLQCENLNDIVQQLRLKNSGD